MQNNIILKYKQKKVKIHDHKYTIIYDNRKRYTERLPFAVLIKDNYPNYACIFNIHKTDKYTGTQMMEGVLHLLKKKKIKKAVLHDGTSLETEFGNIDLSLFKLFEKGITFYQKFGFKLYLTDIESQFFYGDSKNAQNILTNSLTKFKKIQLKQFISKLQELTNIFTSVTKNKDYKNITIKFYHLIEPFYSHSPDKFIDYMLEQLNILQLLTQSNKKYLYELLIELFYNDKEKYIKLLRFIRSMTVISVKYKNKNYKYDYSIIDNIIRIRNKSYFIKNL